MCCCTGDWSRAADRIPGRGRGQFAVDEQHRGLVLQGLERSDRPAELFAHLQVGDHVVDAPARDAGRLGRHQPDRDADGGRLVDAGEHVGGADDEPSTLQGADVAGQVGGRLRPAPVTPDASASSTNHSGSPASVLALDHDDGPPRTARSPDRRTRSAAHPPSAVRGAHLAVRREHERRGPPGHDGRRAAPPRPVRFGGRGHRAGDDGRQQRAGQQAVTGGVEDAGGLGQRRRPGRRRCSGRCTACRPWPTSASQKSGRVSGGECVEAGPGQVEAAVACAKPAIASVSWSCSSVSATTTVPVSYRAAV